MKKRVYLFGIGSPEWQARTGHTVNERGVPIPVRVRRCGSIYPGSVTLRGQPVRCDGGAGHDGPHGNSFAARYWEVT